MRQLPTLLARLVSLALQLQTLPERRLAEPCARIEAISTSAFTLDEAIAVYVPSTTGAVVRRIVLYLQGFRGVCGDTGATPADVMNVFDLAEQMHAGIHRLIPC